MSDPADVRKAIACIKGLLPLSAEEPAMVLSREDSMVLRILGNGLAVSYLIDEGDRFRYVQERDLREQAIDRDRLHSIGLNNLLEVASKNTRVQPYQNIHAVFLDGHFEASLVLLNQLWDVSFRGFLKGTYAVAIPARDVLAFGDASSAAAVQELSELVGRVFPGGDHLVSDRLYVRDGNAWKQRTV